MKTDRGSGTVLFLAVIFVAVSLASCLALGGTLALQQSKLQAVTDAAAVGSNQSLRGLSSGFPCEVAKEILQINMASLQTCSIVGEETRIKATTVLAGIVLTAEAWSAPSKPPQQ